MFNLHKIARLETRVAELERDLADFKREVRNGWVKVPVAYVIDEALRMRLDDIIIKLVKEAGLEIDHNPNPQAVTFKEKE